MSDSGNPDIHLVSGALLTNRYQILRRISSNVFCNYQFKDCNRDCCSPSDSATQYCSTIYQAKDLDLAGRPVTIIEIIGKFTEDLQPLILEKQYKREIELLTRLDHPSIPAIYQFFFDIELGRFYLVMKYIDGSDLATRQRLLGGRVNEFAVTKWAIDICDALDYSHSQSPPILYRDLMPASLMLDEQTNRAMLLDFGIARFLAMLLNRLRPLPIYRIYAAGGARRQFSDAYGHLQLGRYHVPSAHRE